MQRFGTLVYHKLPTTTVICSVCGAAWEERFIGIAASNGNGPAPICPRCIPSPLTVDRVIEAEISTTLLAAAADPAIVRWNVTQRYARFLVK